VTQSSHSTGPACAFCRFPVIPPNMTRDERMVLWGIELHAVASTGVTLFFCERHAAMWNHSMRRVSEARESAAGKLQEPAGSGAKCEVSAERPVDPLEPMKEN
jgi:hypothetical protein